MRQSLDDGSRCEFEFDTAVILRMAETAPGHVQAERAPAAAKFQNLLTVDKIGVGGGPGQSAWILGSRPVQSRRHFQNSRRNISERATQHAVRKNSAGNS